MSKVALLVGVSKYQPGLPALPSVIEDVGAMERVLQHSEIGGFDEVKVLRDPSTQDLRIAIYSLFAERSPEDLVLFYFSGHGVKDQNRNLFLATPETIKNKKGLVVPPTAVAASYLQTQINDSRSEHEVIILDCCYSGAIAKGLTAKDEGEVNIEAQLGGKGRAILTSSTAVQSSFQQEGALSIYTQYLVEGMETGAADLDNDGRISTDELHQYASKKVQQASPAMTPQFYPVEEGYKIYLARSPQDDPKLRYRKEAQKRAEKGEFSLIGRRILARLQIELEISTEEAATIEEEILRPYREFQQKLQEYEQAFREVVEQAYPLSEFTRKELQDFQKLLELRDEDIIPIEAQFSPSESIVPESDSEPEVIEYESEQIFIESVPESKPKNETKSQPSSKTINNKQLHMLEFDVMTVQVMQAGLFGFSSKVELNLSRSQAQYFTEDLGNGITLDLAYILGGSFLMGSPKSEKNSYENERPQHKVTVPAFFMGKFQITQAQWKAIASLPKIKCDLNPNPSNFKGDDRPVEQVSWEDAVEFCQRLSKYTGKEYRLPSEAEWEYACRAGTTTPFHFGDTITTDLANYDGNYTCANGPKGEYRQKTTSVGNFPPNAFGLYDMHGNVREWCQDDWYGNYENASTELNAWFSDISNKKVVRSGSWGDDPDNCRSAIRYDIARVIRKNVIGLRVVCVCRL